MSLRAAVGTVTSTWLSPRLPQRSHVLVGHAERPGRGLGRIACRELDCGGWRVTLRRRDATPIRAHAPLRSGSRRSIAAVAAEQRA